jgi:hypothetical protein
MPIYSSDLKIPPLPLFFRRLPPLRLPLWLIKFLHYEYWDWWFFYLPLLPYYLWLAFKARSFTFFTAANPGIEAGGFFGESKISILNQLPDYCKPATLFFDKNTTALQVLERMREKNIAFPIVGKPDVGERGTKVEKLVGASELQSYLSDNQGDFMVQEFVDFELEMGVMFYRLPGEEIGRVSSITLKKFLSVTGDGISSIEQLMQKDDRARFQLARLSEKMNLEEILPAGRTKLLEPIGNHCRGTLFFNGNHLIDSRLHQVFTNISASFEGFYYGRFDLKVKSLEDLYAGKNIRILELNGVSAEPAHLYDPAYKLLDAYRDLAWHLNIIYQISQRNRLAGHLPVPLGELLKQVHQHFRL